MSEIRSQATPARDQELELKRDLLDGDLLGNVIASDAARMARHAIQRGWSKPRTVNSADELDALPELSVVLVGGQLAAQKDVAWFATGGAEPVEFNDEAWNAGVTVLFTPGDAG